MTTVETVTNALEPITPVETITPVEPIMTTIETAFIRTDADIIDSLIHNEYDLKLLDNAFIVFCKILLETQIFAFNELFEGNIGPGDARYSNIDKKFEGNEQDLLNCANTAKVIHPILKEIDEEISRRDMDYDKMWKNALIIYAKIQGIDPSLIIN